MAHDALNPPLASRVVEASALPAPAGPGGRLPVPTDFPDSPLSQALRQPLLLGVFLNLQDIHRSTLPTSNTWTFPYNARVVQRAEALGFELAFSRAQWLPKGGYDGDASLDPFIALGAMAPVTSRILLISTLHVLYGPLHPLHLAKFGATLDHLSGGRWGLNIVTGHRAVEHEMFGRPRIPHDDRYALAGELLDVVHTLWTSGDNLSFEGTHGWKVKDGYITPKPLYGRPVMVNATGSDAGIRFAARYSDLIFIGSPGGATLQAALETLPAHTAQVRREAAALGRTVRTLIGTHIVSRDTEREAHAQADAIVAGKVRPFHQVNHRYDSDRHGLEARQPGLAGFGRGLGGNVEIVGTPEQVVDQLLALHKTGIDGVQIGLFDFEADLEYFGARILPLLQQAGLRVAP